MVPQKCRSSQLSRRELCPCHWESCWLLAPCMERSYLKSARTTGRSRKAEIECCLVLATLPARQPVERHEQPLIDRRPILGLRFRERRPPWLTSHHPHPSIQEVIQAMTPTLKLVLSGSASRFLHRLHHVASVGRTGYREEDIACIHRQNPGHTCSESSCACLRAIRHTPARLHCGIEGKLPRGGESGSLHSAHVRCASRVRFIGLDISVTLREYRARCTAVPRNGHGYWLKYIWQRTREVAQEQR
jgi:hypothetical protein